MNALDRAERDGRPGQEVVSADAVLLAQRIRRLGGDGRRVLIGIVGAPGSGKSTLSAAVVAELTSGSPPLSTALVGMDGFHLAQRVLDGMGLADIKGAPQTFDSAGYVALLRRLVSAASPGADPGEVVYAPEFRRAIEEPIAGAVAVGSDVAVVITEGNYLLAREPPWDQVAGLLTETWYLDTPQDLRMERLVSRHIAFGRTPEVALVRSTSGTDGRNADVVLATRVRADVLLSPAGDSDRTDQHDQQVEHPSSSASTGR